MKPVGIFGGTFDPIHSGHLVTAEAVKKIRNLDKIIFIPAFVSPHKTRELHSDAGHRLEMVKLAVSDFPFFEVSDYEIITGGISYTVDTLRYFKKQYNEIELIIGYDNLLVFDKWKDPESIFDLAAVLVLNRKVSSDKLDIPYEDKAIFVDTPSIEISSTEIRRRIKEDMPIDLFVTDKVKQYIYKNNLYKD